MGKTVGCTYDFPFLFLSSQLYGIPCRTHHYQLSKKQTTTLRKNWCREKDRSPNFGSQKISDNKPSFDWTVFAHRRDNSIDRPGVFTTCYSFLLYHFERSFANFDHYCQLWHSGQCDFTILGLLEAENQINVQNLWSLWVVCPKSDVYFCQWSLYCCSYKPSFLYVCNTHICNQM